MVQAPVHVTSTLFTGRFSRPSDYSSLRLGGTDDWLLFFTLGGSGYIRHRFGELLTASGDLSLIRPRPPHDYGTDAKTRHWNFIWIHFHPRPNWFEWLRLPQVGPGVLNLPIKNAP